MPFTQARARPAGVILCDWWPELLSEISPFRGVRYNLDVAGDPSRLISPPYDVIGPEEKKRLQEASEYNFVRLVLGDERPGDSDSDNRFTRAAGFLNQWLGEGAMVEEDAPTLYRLRIGYSVGGARKSLTCLTALVKIQDYEDGVILPHEKTLRGPKEGLARLIEATSANLDSVWLLYEDNQGKVGRAINEAGWRPLVEDAAGADGVKYSLDACTDPAQIAAVVESLRDETLTIADGHHRYDTALAYSRRMDSEHPDAADRPWGWVMATLAWTDDPGLTVLPTHRVLKGLPAEALTAIRDRLAGRFDFTCCSPGELAAALDGAGESAFAACGAAGNWLAVPKHPVDALGAELLQQCVLAESLGFDIARLKSDPRISYVEDAKHALAMVERQGYQVAFLVRPIPVRTITRYSRERRSMPQKSTYFYPKLASGLVLRRILSR